MDTIREVYKVPGEMGAEAGQWNCLKTFLKGNRTVYNMYEDLTEALARTSIADREPKARRGWRRASLAHVFSVFSKSKSSAGTRKPSLHLLETAQRFEASKILFSTLNGYIGLGPKDSRKGDIAVLILGARVPFILRPTAKGRHRLIGECYIHGIMDGEFVARGPTVVDLLLV